jgi:hypothetical protein
LFPRTQEYNEKLAKFPGKEPRFVKILKKEGDKGDKECENSIKDVINTNPTSYPYIENIPHINYNEGSLTFMWDKRKGKPKYDQKNNNSWIVPYIIKKKSEKEKYYLLAMDGRNNPLLVDGSLL